MKTTHIFGFSLFCLCIVASSPVKAAPPAEKSPGSRFSAKLEQMLAAVKRTRYQHLTDIDVPAGKFYCDCSGLLGYMLSSSFPEAFLALHGELAPWKSRPLAATFYETFDRAGKNGDGLWQKIPRLIDARPGDLIAWRNPELRKGKSTGHVCMVAGYPLVEEGGRIRIRILDSTDRPHANDTRPAGKNGMGAGEMWFDVNESGRPVAYIPRKGSKRIASNPILIGRLQFGDKAPATTHIEDRNLIGLNEKRAASLAKKRGLDWRVIRRDDAVFSIPFSRLKIKRLNAVIENGKVKRIRRG